MTIEPFGDSRAARTLGAAYDAMMATRNWAFDHLACLSREPPFATVSVGGIRAGGSGKTPVALMLGKAFAGWGCDVAFVSRGYGRRARGVRVVGPQEAAVWEDVGDEPAMLHRALPSSWLAIGAGRRKALDMLDARRAKAGSRLVAILDDGFQHRWVRRRLDIVCVNVDFWDDLPIPAGFRREPVSSLHRAHMVCVVGGAGERSGIRDTVTTIRNRLGIAKVYGLVQEFGAWVSLVNGAETATLPLTRPSMVTGIARPERFVALTEDLGIKPVSIVHFADHHAFTGPELQKALVSSSDGIITTEKDAIRLADTKLANRSSIWYLSLRLAFAEQDAEADFFSTLHQRTLR